MHAKTSAGARDAMTPFWWMGTLGIAAIEVSYLPQIARLYRMKRADELSLFFPSLNLVGRLLALSYALLSHEPVFIFGFLVGAALRATLLVQVAWYRRLAPRRILVPALEGEPVQ
jgi:lipid-A-disaccharide synthase-like uncharacterized protein